MPKTIIDYSKTIIYKLVNYDCPDLVYVGSTTNFTKRKQHHKDAVYNTNSRKYNYKIYTTIRENGNWESWIMIKICNYPCNDNHEAKLEEDRHKMELKANLNMRKATRTKKQYREDNIEIIKEREKLYREDNKEEIKERRSQKYTCECGSSFRQCDKARHIKTIKHQKYLNTIE